MLDGRSNKDLMIPGGEFVTSVTMSVTARDAIIIQVDVREHKVFLQSVFSFQSSNVEEESEASGADTDLRSMRFARCMCGESCCQAPLRWES